MPNQKLPFNVKNTIVIILAGSNAIAYVKQLNKTTTFQEYTNLIYNTVSACNFTIIFLNIVWKTPDLFKFIDNLDNTVKDSKLKIDENFSVIQSFILIVHCIRTHTSRIACTIHRDQPTNSKVDEIYAFSNCEGGACVLYCTNITS